jgi:hypothetical protein
VNDTLASDLAADGVNMHYDTGGLCSTLLSLLPVAG